MSAQPPSAAGSEGQALDTAIGIALVVISALEIWFIVRVVGANMKS